MIILSKIILHKNFQKVEWTFYILPLLLCVFVPILGIFISIFIIGAIFRLHTKFFKYTERVDDSINLKEVKYSYEEYGAGGAFLRLMKKNAPPADRTKALFVLAQGQLSGINNLLQELLPDSSDEIRLLSFNILDQQESFIQKDINKILSSINAPGLDATAYAIFEKNLALLYWELSYRHLLLKELEDITLNKAETYAQSALKILKGDAVLWSLLGKIYFRLKKYKLAEESFEKSIYYDIPDSQVIPYLAEIKYKMKDYAAVRRYLCESNTLLDIAIIAPVKRFWEKNE
jgi:tetratricopeptide (TPR) repeat protein